MTEQSYPVTTFVRMVDGVLTQKGAGSVAVHAVLDSRQSQVRDGSIFFALVTARNDGHKYLHEAFKKGIRNFVVSSDADTSELPDSNIVKVADTLTALQAFAGSHRAEYDFPVLAVTGSNGKTIVKEWLAQMISGTYRVVKSPKSYNSQIGVPLSLLRLREAHNLAIIEAGVSLPGEMPRLERMIRPDWGLFTTIGPAHQENFASLDQKIQEKLSLFDRSSKLFYCSDHSAIKAGIATRWHMNGPEIKDWSFSDPGSTLFISRLSQKNGKTTLLGKYNGLEREVVIPFVSRASIENACHCWLPMLELNIDADTISAGLSALAPVGMRLEQLAGIHGCVVINDVYNSDYSSLEIAVEHLKLQRKNDRFTAIVSDIPNAGEDLDPLYERAAALLRRSGIDRLIGIGPEISARRHLFTSMEVSTYPSTEIFLSAFKKDAFHNENILIKGARSFAFERISERLEEKTHETVLEINLNKMAENLAYIRSSLNPETKIMVMVKAFAYGSGGYDIARFLELRKVDYLAVAYADEGVALRQAGIVMPIMVLNPEVSSFDAMIRYQLEPQIFSFRTLALFSEAVASEDDAAPFPIHIKINTGMNRLGFEPREADKLARMLQENDRLHTVSVFTHLSGSENPDFDTRTALQLQRFDEAVKALRGRLRHPFMCHALNSSGVFRHPEAQMDMVRVGLALYGLSGNPKARTKLRPVGRLKTTISQIREVAAGEGIGYTPNNVLDEQRTIAVLPIGYADGMPRKLGNGNWKVHIHGKKVPIIGNICMDMAMVDVTGLDCSEGDEAEVFGERCTIYDLAQTLDTIPYEVLTNISSRVKRVFHQE